MSSTKRMLVFSLAYYPRFVGGAEVALKEITDRIAQGDIEFHLVTLRFDSALPRYERLGHVHIHRIGYTTHNPSIADLHSPLHRLNKALFQITAALKGVSLHRTYHFNAAWAMMAHSAGIPATLFNMMTGVPYALTIQEGDPPAQIERQMRVFGPLFHRAFTHARVVQTISTFLGDWARRMGFEGPLVIIPNGVDLAHFSRTFSAAECAPIKKQLGIKRGEAWLMTASRLVRKNAVDDVIRALPLLPVNVRFAVLGIGPEEEALRELARELGVSERVRFVGHIGHADLPRYLACADIFVRPSRSEGMGNAFIEAFAAGLPVIATQEGGISDFLFDAKRNPDREATGFAVDADAPADIARAVLAILDDPAAAKKTAANARTLAVSHYDWGGVALSMRTQVFVQALGRAA